MDVHSYTAIITPFLENGQLDLEALSKLASNFSHNEWGIVVLGTTGERMSLSPDEEQIVIQTVVDNAASRVPVFVGAGCSCTHHSVKRTKLAKQLGADGILAIVPYYNKPPFRGILKHFEAIAAEGLPVIVYHHPKRTGTSLNVDELLTLSQIQGVEAIKEASGDLVFAEKLIQTVSVPVLCGDDALTLEMFKKGAKGTVSVVSNIIPDLWNKMIEQCLQKQWKEADAINSEYKALIQAIGLEVNPIGVKFAMSLLERCQCVFRLPLCEPLDATKQAIQSALFSNTLRFL